MSETPVSLKRHVAQVLRQMPWLASIAVTMLRLTQPRFTAGTVGVIWNEHNQILLVEHVFHPLFPWGLPGGWIDRHELPAEALKRELREELGMEIAVLEPLAISIGDYHRGHLDIAFLCRAENAVQHLSREVLDYRWASCDALPPMTPFHRQAVIAACSRRQNEVQ